MLSRARIQFVRSLSEKAVRRESGLFVIEGRKMLSEALEAGAEMEAVYLSSRADAELAHRAGKIAPCEYVSDKEMERISHMKTPSEALAVVRIPHPKEQEPDYTRELVLFLDGVQDPGNLGTIIRIADWFGIGRIVCSPDSADCYNPKTVQATMGALFRVAVSYRSLEDELACASAVGINIYGTFLDGEELYGVGLSRGGIVIMGSEGRGISPGAARFVNRKLFIPPYPSDRRGSESLNVAVATAVVCAEFRRRCGLPK